MRQLQRQGKNVFQKNQIVRFMMAVSLGGLIALLAAPPLALAVNLLANGNFEAYQSYNGENWRGFPEKIGQGWNVQVIDEDGLHFMDSDTFGQFLTATFGVPYLNYRLEGTYAQAFASRRRYNFVLYQTVPVTNGQAYAFGGKVVSFWKGSGGETDHTKIRKRVGIDPTGGVDYSSGNVIWSDWDSTDNAWTSPALAVTSAATQATVFIQVHNTADDVGAAHLNTGYIDNFKFELAPVASLNLPAQSAPGSVNVSWSAVIADGFWNLWGYDVEYKDNAAGVWHTIQTHSSGSGQNTGYTLNAQAGKIYTFRVRPWMQEAPNGSPITTAMPGLWVEKSLTIGQAVAGRVANHAGLGQSGVTVSVSGAATSTTSLNDGSYALPTGADGNFEIVAGNHNGLVAPPAVTVNVPPGGVGQLDITLRPTGPAQGITNNDFETDLANWNSSNGPAVGASTADKHTGQRSLLISNTVGVSQTNTVTGMDRPLLSFWYRSDVSFTVEFLGTGGIVKSVTIPASAAWSHFTLESGLGAGYSGPVGVNFINNGGPANIFVDEVSIGSGPAKTFLPVITKS